MSDSFSSGDSLPLPMGPPAMDFPGRSEEEMSSRITMLEIMLSQYGPYDITAKSPGGPIRVNVLGIPIGEGELDEGSGTHMWKVTAAGEDDSNPPIPLYKVLGGIAVVQGARVEVAGVDALPTGANGFVVLKVVRNSASRAYVSSAIEWHPDVEPESSDYEEYTVLAEVNSGGVIEQCRNDEICSFELMIVANGELKLLPFQANSRNSYDPPS
jgi:hypothetical protein